MPISISPSLNHHYEIILYLKYFPNNSPIQSMRYGLFLLLQ
ncbi:hypothetical protein BACINT_03704 [Bacteroides intestinalis DSM 17393]|uniref:Uncharacterized protein n=1 Tax=Bacteroides intestinalis DSM 17393 TaxID=471870 RepID=B3CBW3_9BACE|nr:hypothetical protein BACINT_03704 [Bacteroides intestinalis DSM 17393]